MDAVVRAFKHLHQEPSHWDLDTYTDHAWRVSRNVWVVMIVVCIVVGAAMPPHNPAKMFDEYRPFTIYTVVMLGVCGVVCAQCGGLAGGRDRHAWRLMSAGFFFLAIDDLTGIHERFDKIINHALGWDPKALLPDLIDAGIVVLYGMVGVAALFIFRRLFFALKGFARGIAKAAVAAVVMVILDVAGDMTHNQIAKVLVGITEDSFESLAVCFFFCTFVTSRHQLRAGRNEASEARLSADVAGASSHP